MTSPITGPFPENFERKNGSGVVVYVTSREVWKQKRPFDVPLPFKFSLGSTLAGNGYTAPANEWRLSPSVNNGHLISAYDKLKGSAQDQAELAVSIIEARQALGMMTNRLLSLVTFARRLRRGDIAGAARHLGVMRPRGSSRRKKFADLWLEYSFGWKPLVQDIYTTVDVLQSPFTSGKISGGYKFAWSYSPNVTAPYSRNWVTNGVSYLRMGAEVRIDNPNLYLANQLGLTNPASVAWELVPFSFVVDWFSNVGQVLALGTDFLGLSVTNKWTVFGAQGLTQYSWNNYPWTSEVFQHRLERGTTWTLPSVGLRPARLWGWQRCANASALLIQLLKGR